MHEIKFRLVNPALRPRRTMLEMPGWAGQREPRTDGSQEYAWRWCRSPKARSTASRYFIHTTMSCGSLKDGQLSFVGDFGPPPEGDLLWPPFRSFGRGFHLSAPARP